MLETIVKLLPTRSSRIATLLVLVSVGSMIGGIKGLGFVKAYAQETARNEVTVIINKEIREAAKEAAMDAARIAAREAAKETLEQIRAELSKQSASLKRIEAGQQVFAAAPPKETVHVERVEAPRATKKVP